MRPVTIYIEYNVLSVVKCGQSIVVCEAKLEVLRKTDWVLKVAHSWQETAEGTESVDMLCLFSTMLQLY